MFISDRVRTPKARPAAIVFAAIAAAFAMAAFAWPGASVKAPGTANTVQAAQSESGAMDDAALLEGFRHVEAASVSDALEQITGKKMYMTHHMRPIFPTKFAGFAVTVLLKKE